MLNNIYFFSIIILVNLLIYYFYKPIANIYNLYDKPDFERKIHKKKIPLLGGLFLLINLSLIILLNLIYPEILNSFFFGNIKNFFSFFFYINIILFFRFF